MIRGAILRGLQQGLQVAPQAGFVLAAGLVAPLADGAPGDLDPGFGDAGRVVTDVGDFGEAWSLELDDDGDGFLAGGGYYCYYWYSCYLTNFSHSFSSAGALDLDYTHPDLPDTLIRDTARQADGKLVGVGQTLQGSARSLIVFRLLPDGTLDGTFGEGGRVQLVSAADTTNAATTVVIEPDGRIVVAGSRGSQLLVLRLLDDGALDEEFGDSGVVVGPENLGAAGLVRLADGGYRVTTLAENSDPALGATCRIVGLAADGTSDPDFGTAGSVDVAQDGITVTCNDFAIQPDGRLLVAGQASQDDDTSGVLVRLVSDGSLDNTFSAADVGESMSEATALALDAAGRVLVAGRRSFDTAGALVARLDANGVLDTTYGNAGTTWVDVPSAQAQLAVIRDMVTGTDGSLTVAGGYGSALPFAARLRGDGSDDAPGVISLTHPRVAAAEGAAPVVVTVRRAGGKAGAVSVTYRTAPLEGAPPWAGAPGSDFPEVTGQLSWEDGDTTERTIEIPIPADGPTPEGFESFQLVVDSVDGGAGLGGRSTFVEIAPDGAPAGQLLILVPETSVLEGRSVEILVERAFYRAGEVSVTVVPSGTATGADYQVQPTTLTWADGEQGTKSVLINARADSLEETSETLTLTLTDPTGGAIIGASASGSVSIVNQIPRDTSGGGSGTFGWASLLALCAAGVRRFSRRGARQTS